MVKQLVQQWVCSTEEAALLEQAGRVLCSIQVMAALQQPAQDGCSALAEAGRSSKGFQLITCETALLQLQQLAEQSRDCKAASQVLQGKQPYRPYCCILRFMSA